MTRVFGLAAYVLAGLLVAGPGLHPAAAKDPPHIATITWQTQAIAATTSGSASTISPDTALVFTRIHPIETFRAPEKMTTGADSISVGAILARTVQDASQFCEPVRRRKQSYMYCVSDSDGDDLLDTLHVIPTVSVSGSTSFHYEFLIGPLRMYSGRKLQNPVPISSLVPESSPDTLDVMFTQSGKTRVALCIFRHTGSSLVDGLGDAKFCGQMWDLKKLALPTTLRANGGAIDVSRGPDGQYQAKITPPPAGIAFPDEGI